MFFNSYDFFKMGQCNQDLSVITIIVKSEPFETDMLNIALQNVAVFQNVADCPNETDQLAAIYLFFRTF